MILKDFFLKKLWGELFLFSFSSVFVFFLFYSFFFFFFLEGEIACLDENKEYKVYFHSISNTSWLGAIQTWTCFTSHAKDKYAQRRMACNVLSHVDMGYLLLSLVTDRLFSQRTQSALIANRPIKVLKTNLLKQKSNSVIQTAINRDWFHRGSSQFAYAAFT